MPALLVVAFLALAGPIGSLAGRTAEVQENDNAAYLPTSAESTQVDRRLDGFAGGTTLPAVIVYTRSDGGALTETDRSVVSRDVDAIYANQLPVLAGPPVGPVFSEDGRAAQVIVEYAGDDPEKVRGDIGWVRDRVHGHEELTAHVTGPGGVLADLLVVFDTINGVLLAVTAGVVLLILVAVYRSPLLPLLVLVSAGAALGLANGTVYLLAKNDLVTLSGQTQGILDVLVLGAGTDYALLVVSRYREELRRHENRFDAMRVAWRASVEPVLASGGTVILGLLCLLISDLASNRGLGPVAGIGIACALLSMLVFLPAVLALAGRVVFWPFPPAHRPWSAGDAGIWARVAALVGRRSRAVWALTVVVLAVLSLGLFRLEASGIPQTESFVGQTDSQDGQRVLGEHFPAGAGSPAIILVRAERSEQVVFAVRRVDGVAAVVPFTGTPAGDTTPAPMMVDGYVRLDVTLRAAPDSPAADAAVRELRRVAHGIAGADAKVGGFTAINLDVQDTARRDRTVIIPVVLVVVFLILMLLLRSVVAPVLLIATVVLSFLATLGVSGVMFRDVLGFAGADSSYPLFAFVFLVALGIDYNIFLMTRIREEAGRRGHREGTLLGLSVTGGVITSAGVVLAATFAALGVLPLVFLAELAFTVAFGVLLDTLIVRSLLVPAVTVELGRWAWWPGRLSNAPVRRARLALEGGRHSRADGAVSESKAVFGQHRR
ncbi:membrane protein [Virgisporangium aurantiacum]|uniref:Membrane protein n=1 Tax=Virgisporangium aurantiacum TaxID=175570 RepID=A0A8J4E748_9ACTN|nr:membrane protein [Virgisporangium aurantiacum]